MSIIITTQYANAALPANITPRTTRKVQSIIANLIFRGINRHLNRFRVDSPARANVRTCTRRSEPLSPFQHPTAAFMFFPYNYSLDTPNLTAVTTFLLYVRTPLTIWGPQKTPWFLATMNHIPSGVLLHWLRLGLVLGYSVICVSPNHHILLRAKQSPDLQSPHFSFCVENLNSRNGNQQTGAPTKPGGAWGIGSAIERWLVECSNAEWKECAETGRYASVRKDRFWCIRLK